MGYLPISIKEALSKINHTWFLPAIQRPYVWGNRYDSEKYICRLFDSLYRKYPIGVIIMWETNTIVVYREFLRNYKFGDTYENVDEGLWQREDKCLIYDGQQRLQTLYSCLKYSFNKRLLVFDLLYDPDNDEDSDTGFRFVDKDYELENHEIKLNTLFALNPSTNLTTYLLPLINAYDPISEIDKIGRISTNLDMLWDVFVKNDTKSLAYFSIASDNEQHVNEIFERLNTGGIPLSKADLLFSKIKAYYPGFESDIMGFLKEKQISFSSYDILQLLSLIVRNRSRFDDNLRKGEAILFNDAWVNIQMPLTAFFHDYLNKRLNITSLSIIRNKLPLLVITVFLYKYYKSGKKYRDLDDKTLQLIDRFLILSEFNDWTLQSYTDNFTKLILNNHTPFHFPYDQIEEFVKQRGNRFIPLHESVFTSHRWMALKFLMPNRYFEFNPTIGGRFNPELDHIFPLNPQKPLYNDGAEVDVVWNMQPIKGEINNLKTNHHPLEFFKDEASNAHGTRIYGSKYFDQYDFMPALTAPLWNDPVEFIKYRRSHMIDFLKSRYGITLITDVSDRAQAL